MLLFDSRQHRERGNQGGVKHVEHLTTRLPDAHKVYFSLRLLTKLTPTQTYNSSSIPVR